MHRNGWAVAVTVTVLFAAGLFGGASARAGEASVARKKQVFLGGSCNPTTWRKDAAIPAIEKAKVAFYNPQVDDWKPELVEVEARAKAESEVLLFVIDAQTRSIASILEATEYTVAGRLVLLVVDDIADGTAIEGQKVTGRELKDLNRARAYLRDLADRHPNATVYPDVAAAVAAVVKHLAP